MRQEPGCSVISLPQSPTTDQIRDALYAGRGNIHAAAKILSIDYARLAYILSRNEDLQSDRARAGELLLDRAEEVIAEELQNPDTRLPTARWLLETAGKQRGYGKDAPNPLGLTFGDAKAGQIAIKWQIE